jgi:hypothetical protein
MLPEKAALISEIMVDFFREHSLEPLVELGSPA